MQGGLTNNDSGQLPKRTCEGSATLVYLICAHLSDLVLKDLIDWRTLWLCAGFGVGVGVCVGFGVGVGVGVGLGVDGRIGLFACGPQSLLLPDHFLCNKM